VAAKSGEVAVGEVEKGQLHVIYLSAAHISTYGCKYCQNMKILRHTLYSAVERSSEKLGLMK